MGKRLRELLAELGGEFEAQVLSSHPQDMLNVVKGGDGFALLREGTLLMEGLATRTILGVDWTVDTAVVYKRNPKSKLIPIIAKNLKRRFPPPRALGTQKKRSETVRESERPSQMRMLVW